MLNTKVWPLQAPVDILDSRVYAHRKSRKEKAKDKVLHPKLVIAKGKPPSLGQPLTPIKEGALDTK